MKPEVGSSRLVSVKEAAQRAQVNEKTIRRLTDSRQIAVVRIGRRVLIAESELLDFFRRRTQPAIDASAQAKRLLAE
jgi:excisionase family DNA binding protein